MKSGIHNFFLKTFFLSSVSLFIFSGCRKPYQRDEGMIWNTTYHITYQSDRLLTDSILNILQEVDNSLSVFNKNSLVCKVNSTDSTEINSFFRDVYTTSLLINNASGGMFDPTVSPLVTAWGFGPGHKISTDTVAIDSILQFIGIHKTHLNDNTLVKDDIRIQFNFSAIAKGYGCDMVAEMFRRNDVQNFLVEIGGEITAGGESPRGGDWKISIDRPVMSDKSISHDSNGVVALTNCGIATSGNYRNFHTSGGKTFGHTISPLDGKPMSTDVISATVMAQTCMEADGAATACMAVGSGIAKEMLKKLGYEGMLILSDSTVWMSEGFRDASL